MKHALHLKEEFQSLCLQETVGNAVDMHSFQSVQPSFHSEATASTIDFSYATR